MVSIVTFLFSFVNDKMRSFTNDLILSVFFFNSNYDFQFKQKKKLMKYHELFFCGNYLLSHVVSNEVPSAFERLTTVFGMGTGGTVQASSPHT